MIPKVSNKIKPSSQSEKIKIFSSVNPNSNKNESNPNIVQDQSTDTYTKSLQTGIDIINHKFPFCLVWSPITFITPFLPSIGHVGICESNGIIHNFSGTKIVLINKMAFGWPLKYAQLNLSFKERTFWDKSIIKGDHTYLEEEYNFFKNNCHSYCAYILSYLKYKGKSNYNMLSIWWILSTKGKYVSWNAVFKTYIWFILIIIVITVIIVIILIAKKRI